MSEIQWQAHRATAAANDGRPQLPVAEGYVGEIIDAGAKPTKAGTPQLWWQVKVLVGPHAGKVEKLTQTFNPGNPNALSAFYGVTERIGINFDNIPDGTPAEAIAKLAIGNKIKFNFEHREDKNTGRVYADFKRLERIDAAPAPAAPAVTVAQVAPVAPVAPVAVAVEVPAPSAAPTIEEQIAALQAQQAAAVAAPAVAAETVAAAPAKGKLPF